MTLHDTLMQHPEMVDELLKAIIKDIYEQERTRGQGFVSKHDMNVMRQLILAWVRRIEERGYGD